MAIPTNDRVTGPYAATGAQTAFPYDFKIFDDDDLRVVLSDSAGVETVLTKTTHYSVSGAGDENGGTVTTLTAYSSGNTITIYGDSPVAQDTSFSNQGAILPSVVELALDRIVAIIQELKRQQGKAIAAPASDGTVDMTLPAKAARAGLFAAYGANGEPTAVAVASTIGVTPYMQGLLESAAGSDALKTLGLGGVFPVDVYGASGDGRGSITVSVTATDSTVTAPGSTFTSADEGRVVMIAGAGTSGAAHVTTISSVTSDTEAELTAPAVTSNASGGMWIGTDNKDAIANAVSAAAVAGGIVLFGSGTYCTSEAIDLTNLTGVHLVGVAKQSGAGPTNFGSHVWPFHVDNIVDASGATHCSATQMQFGRSDIPVVLQSGMLAAPVSGHESISLNLFDCFVIGKFAKAALYNYGVPDCKYHRSQFYNYYDDGAAHSVVVSRTNIRGVTSSNVTVNTGAIDVSNTEFVDCHLIEQANPAGASTTPVLLDGVVGFGMAGCNFGATSSCVVIADQGAGSENIIIRRSVMAAAYASTDPTYGIRVDSTATIKGFALEDNTYNDDGVGGTGGPTTSILHFASGSRVDGLRITGSPSETCALIDGGGTSALYGQGWYVEAGGMSIALPGRVEHAVFVNPGTITEQSGVVSSYLGRNIRKAGSGGGNYSTTSTSLVAIDASNLATTLTIPTGMSAKVSLSASALNDTAGNGVLLAIAVGGSAVAQSDITSPSGGQVVPAHLSEIITGTGSAITISGMFAAVTGSTARLRNSSAAEAPRLIVELGMA